MPSMKGETAGAAGAATAAAAAPKTFKAGRLHNTNRIIAEKQENSIHLYHWIDCYCFVDN